MLSWVAVVLPLVLSPSSWTPPPDTPAQAQAREAVATEDATSSALLLAMREEASNIWVQPALRETVARLWRDSPTFREQVHKIGTHAGATHVVLMLAPSVAILDRSTRAECSMRRYESGLLYARVLLRLVNQELHELIPHELEHICEYLDGINVAREAWLGRSGFFALTADRIETTRAINAGRRARAEMQQAATLLTSR